MSQPQLIAVSDRKSLKGLDLLQWACRVAQLGVSAIQLREKDLGDPELIKTAVSLRAELQTHTQLYINGRPDIAVLCGANGVHLPAQGLPTEAVHRCFGSSLRVGRSAHSLKEVEAAEKEGADYVFLGPIFDSPAKRRYGPPLGLAVLEKAAKVGIPVYAIGGVSSEHLASIAAAGAAGAAGIRVFQDSVRTSDMVLASNQHFKESNTLSYPNDISAAKDR